MFREMLCSLPLGLLLLRHAAAAAALIPAKKAEGKQELKAKLDY